MNSRIIDLELSRIHSLLRWPARPLARTGGRLLGLAFLAATLLLASLASPNGQARQNKAVRLVAPVQLISEDQFEEWVFRLDGTASGARQRMERSLALLADDIDRTCQLTAAQKQKLLLMGKGDLKRFFDRYALLKEKFQKKPDLQNAQEVIEETNPLAITVQAGLFNDGSLFHKSILNLLTVDQAARYQAAVQDRRQFRHQATIKLVVAMLDQGAPMLDAQRQKLITCLTQETRPAPITGPYTSYYLIWQLGQLPDEKLKPLFDDAQWKVVNRFLVQYQGFENLLRQAGYFTSEDDEGERPGGRAADLKK
jgi:hypothetical protein